MFRRPTTARRPSFRPACEPLESRLAPATFTVTNQFSAGSGSLAQAIEFANATPGADLIRFNIPGSGDKLIGGVLPTITDTVTIDGYSQPGTQPNSLPVGSDAIRLIKIWGGFLRLSPGSSNSTIRGLMLANNPDMAGYGIELDCVTGVRISGNFIGPDRAEEVGYAIGVVVGERNPSCGIGNVIGGPNPEDRNVISGNLTGIELFSMGNTVQNNYIGTNAAGTAAGPDASPPIPTKGVIVHSDLNRIGDLKPGTTTYLGNVISGNEAEGILIHGQSNRLYANYVGTNAAGTAALPNGQSGIVAGGAWNRIGGPAPGEGNLISGNGGAGIQVQGSHHSVINNRVGTNAAGTAAVPNASSGILVLGSSNTLGGATADEGNLISGNVGSGIEISGTDAFGNSVGGNRIGLSVGGAALRNRAHGVLIRDGASANTVSDNTIAHNGTSVGSFGLGNGVRVAGANTVDNRITANRIHSNVRLGIDLEPAGVTPNDGLDIDGGPNGLQNYPTVTSALQGDGGLTVSFGLHSRPNRSFRIEFFGNDACDSSGYGEGRTYLTAFTGQTNGVGNLPASQVFVNLRIPPAFVTATATNLDTGDTSEFSECEQVRPDPLSAPGPGGWLAEPLRSSDAEAAVVPTAPAARPARMPPADAFWAEYRAGAAVVPAAALHPPWPRPTDLAEAVRLDAGLEYPAGVLLAAFARGWNEAFFVGWTR